MSNTQLKSFKAQLKKLKRDTGLDIDTESILKSIQEIPEQEKDLLDREALIMARIKIDSIIKDYEDFFGPQGKGLEITIKITKDNPADQVGEQWIMGEDQKIKVRRFEQIGTKGKHTPFKAIHSTDVKEEK